MNDDELHQSLLRAAVQAPSMLNTQPWLFRFDGPRIELYRDAEREAHAEDPESRGALISLGAVAFNLRVAAAYDGFLLIQQLFPADETPTCVARFELQPAGAEELEPLAVLYESVFTRRTNRLPYSEAELAEQIRTDLSLHAAAEGAYLEWIRDAGRMRWLLRLAADAELEDAYDPARVAERKRWIGGERTSDGISSEAAGPRRAEPSSAVRDFADFVVDPGEAVQYERHPHLAVLSTKADHPADRFRAGAALQRVWLTATAYGLAVSPLTGAIEHRSLRWLIRDPLAGWSEPQSLLRFGYGPPTASASPRRPLEEFVLPSS